MRKSVSFCPLFRAQLIFSPGQDTATSNFGSQAETQEWYQKLRDRRCKSRARSKALTAPREFRASAVPALHEEASADELLAKPGVRRKKKDRAHIGHQPDRRPTKTAEAAEWRLLLRKQVLLSRKRINMRLSPHQLL